MVLMSQALLLLPAPPFWSALFFLLLAVMGHRYLCFWVEPVLRAPFELQLERWRRKRLQVVIGCCLLMLAAGMALVGSVSVRHTPLQLRPDGCALRDTGYVLWADKIRLLYLY